MIANHVTRRCRRSPSLSAAVLLVLRALTSSSIACAAEAVVESFSPQGTIKQVRQVTAAFSEPMVPLGDPRAGVVPFEIDCAEHGKGRWVDSRNWAFDFDRDLPAGVRCAFTTSSGLHSLAGTPVTAAAFHFSTGGPAIIASDPANGDEAIDEEQAFVLVLDSEATEESILRHASFVVDGLPQAIGVRLIKGDQREAILGTEWRGFLNGPAVVLQARQRFPSTHRVKLVWSAGIATKSGVATDAPQIMEFRTRPALPPTSIASARTRTPTVSR
ncbi:MAG: hypothetical protein HY270_10030 [Deltaproteobacteria bacterium]|nr:hypothetical protein [Deltaproteobacteria bacterium]